MNMFIDSNLASLLITLIEASVVVYAALVAVGQLKEMTRARSLEGMVSIYEMIGSEEAREHRRFVYALTEKPEALTETQIT